MSQSDSEQSDSDPSGTLARIEYRFALSQLLKLSTAGVNSKDDARLWALRFRDSWVRLLHLLLRKCLDVLRINFLSAPLLQARIPFPSLMFGKP